MSKYVYLNSSDKVVACSLIQRELTEPKLVSLSATTRINNAPDAVNCESSSDIYHVKTSGDGSDISHYTEYEYLDNLQNKRYEEIDEKTQELILLGFEYPASSGNIFSLTANAQRLYMVIKNISEDIGYTDYPIKKTVMDDSFDYSITDATDAKSMYDTSLLKIKSKIDSGITLKAQIRDAATIAAINAIIDNRT